MTNLYLVISSIIFPILAICWLCCIACCIYKSLLKSFSKNPRSTKVETIQASTGSSESSNISTGQSFSSQSRFTHSGHFSETSTPGTMPMVDDDLRSPYGPVMNVPENLKRSLKDKSLSDSFGPVYYPKHPQSRSGGTPTYAKPSPMTPLQAPWPHLPPLPNKKKSEKRVPTSIRAFLDNQ